MWTSVGICHRVSEAGVISVHKHWHQQHDEGFGRRVSALRCTMACFFDIWITARNVPRILCSAHMNRHLQQCEGRNGDFLGTMASVA